MRDLTDKPRGESTHDQRPIESECFFMPSGSYQDDAKELVENAFDKGQIDPEERVELLALLSNVPDQEGSGLSPEHYQQFLTQTLQLVEGCLCRPGKRASGFLNEVVQSAIDRHFEQDPGWKLAEISNERRLERKGHRIVGQMQPIPNQATSFVTVWDIHRGDDALKIQALITAEPVEDALKIKKFPGDVAEHSAVLSRLMQRNEKPWMLQVEPESTLGEWIQKLAGAQFIGQLKGSYPLGVLTEAVKDSLESQNLTHYLLPHSRRDPDTKPWHTGQFLSQNDGDSSVFTWSGYALDEQGDVVQVEAKVRLKADITGKFDL